MKISGISAAAIETQLDNHTKKSTPNSAPGSVMTAYVTHSSASPPRRNPRPTAMKSQPIGLLGSRATIAAPTVT